MKSKSARSKPKIIGFCCNWCAYAAADLAGSARLSYPAGLKIVRVMCSGMVHPNLIQEAFSAGADGVLVFGCHPGQCHYQDGNLKALARLEVVEEMLAVLDLEPDRFELAACSAAEADRFARTVNKMSARLARLGPSPLARQAAEKDREAAASGSAAGLAGELAEL